MLLLNQSTLNVHSFQNHNYPLVLKKKKKFFSIELKTNSSLGAPGIKGIQKRGQCFLAENICRVCLKKFIVFCLVIYRFDLTINYKYNNIYYNI